MQQLYYGWANVMGHKLEVEDIADICRSHSDVWQSDCEPLFFNQVLILKSVSYSYKSDPSQCVLNGINLNINKGDKIGFIGKTGSGKSTLVDIIMGLLTNIDGEILVDGVPVSKSNIGSWRSHIAHVPQEIFLKDDTIASNVAFTEQSTNFDIHRVEEAVKRAQLSDFIDKVPEGATVFSWRKRSKPFWRAEATYWYCSGSV